MSAFSWPIPVVVGYGIGSLPFGWAVVKGLTGRDLRSLGSGNVGATNALRTVGMWPAMLVAALDLLKGGVAVGAVAVSGAGLGAECLACVSAIVGHVFPVWLGFRGGKGVATACGAFAALAPPPTLLAVTVFAAAVSLTRIVSLASLIGAVTLVVATWIGASVPVAWAATVSGLLIAWAHRTNIGRLARGTERRVGERESFGPRDADLGVQR